MAISAAELAQIQADMVAVVCDQSCVVQRKTTTPGTIGEPVASWATIETTVAGLSEPSANDLQNYDYLIGDKATWKVRLPVGTNVRTQDHLLINGATLEVHVLLVPQSYQALLTLLAAEIT